MENLISPLRFLNEKIYVAPNPKGRVVRRAMELLEGFGEAGISEQDVDVLAQFLSDLYGSKFDVNDIYEGIGKENVLNIILDRIRAVVKMFIAAANKQAQSGEEPAGKTATPLEALNTLYREIMKQGWTLCDLDESDFFALMNLLIKPEETHYIDELF